MHACVDEIKKDCTVWLINWITCIIDSIFNLAICLFGRMRISLYSHSLTNIYNVNEYIDICRTFLTTESNANKNWHITCILTQIRFYLRIYFWSFPLPRFEMNSIKVVKHPLLRVLLMTFTCSFESNTGRDFNAFLIPLVVLWGVKTSTIKQKTNYNSQKISFMESYIGTKLYLDNVVD